MPFSANFSSRQNASRLNRFDESDDIPVPTMTTAQRHRVRLVAFAPLVSFMQQLQTNLVLRRMNAGNSSDRWRLNASTASLPKRITPKSKLAIKTNHQAGRCWKGTGEHLNTENFKLVVPKQMMSPLITLTPITNKQLPSLNT